MELVEPELVNSVKKLSNELLPVIEYHFGWKTIKGIEAPEDTGKRLRPSLAVLSAEAVGRDMEVAIPGAVAVELIHNFSLIHDDIIDGDKERRHRPSAWTAFSIEDALIAGDALHTLAFQVLLEENTPERVQAARRLVDATTTMISGQAADMTFDDLPTISFEECLKMEAAKTGALLGYSSSVGAILSGADENTCNALEVFGYELGLAYQAVDDVLGIWGDPKITGKPAGNDLREKKKSMPVSIVLSANNSDSEKLLEIFSTTEDLDEEEIVKASALIENAGGREATLEEADEHLKRAIEFLNNADIRKETFCELEEIAHFVVNRDS
ncbi:MAG: polyprenyl synthetase family protein [Actinomycetota bacterium]|nr:polyprenyl synthetase family protein [Acidimicrobiales bacterium]MEC7899072.1 polyprenyl synthetase family protein [Actinomycetota bacterium]|tara:strand:- start:22 stop:1002 length:981 start_codon:yes stop_codon:yes gene_type:complete